MNLKQFLTNLNPFKKEVIHKRKVTRPTQGEPLEPKMDVKDAVKAIPKELIDQVESYRSVKFQNTKLNEEQQLELMEHIARFAHIDEINEYFFTNYKITLSPPLIYQYKRTAKWKPIIKKLREKYLLGEDEVPGRHKRVRLDRADKIYQKAEKERDYKTALQANRDLQEMVEGKHSHGGDVSMTFNQYNVLDDAELQERIKETQAKLARVVDIKPKEIEES